MTFKHFVCEDSPVKVFPYFNAGLPVDFPASVHWHFIFLEQFIASISCLHHQH